ncbi:FAD-dependent oxidoreductase [Jiangella alkaliphila]
MKVVLDEMALAAGVDVRLHTRASAAGRDAANRLGMVITESKSGREAWAARVVVDATGDGDVAALAGCQYDYGHPRTGETQPMSLMALLTGLRLDDVAGFVAGGARPPGGRHAAVPPSRRYQSATASLLGELGRAGIEPSFTAPTLWCIYEDLFALMANHQYGVSALNADEISRATMETRIEIDRVVSGLRSLGGVWAGLRLVATGAQLGVREGRRIHGRYRVTAADMLDGRRHHDAVCRVTSPADIYALSAGEGGSLSRAAEEIGGPDRPSDRVRTQPYDVPLRALIARDVDGLLTAGRCISGDFFAHGSYRMTGNAVAMGQAAGVTAAIASTTRVLPHEVPWEVVQRQLESINTVAAAGRRVPASPRA